MGRRQSKNSITLPCKFGTLVCEVVRNDTEYRELAIDLVRPDGRAYQVAVIGTDERGSDQFSEKKIHVYLWDGDDQEYCQVHGMNPEGEGYYGEAVCEDEDSLH